VKVVDPAAVLLPAASYVYDSRRPVEQPDAERVETTRLSAS
jgi:hypothetical protein